MKNGCRSPMFKCAYCKRWECSCFRAATEGGPDDEIAELRKLLDQANKGESHEEGKTN